MCKLSVVGEWRGVAKFAGRNLLALELVNDVERWENY
jgi:hypothetical protein